jgi:hypothetical protein
MIDTLFCIEGHHVQVFNTPEAAAETPTVDGTPVTYPAPTSAAPKVFLSVNYRKPVQRDDSTPSRRLFGPTSLTRHALQPEAKLALRPATQRRHVLPSVIS